MKFISCSYVPENGVSTVVMQHLGVKFTGISKVHPDEFDKASEFAGGYYAELRATIKALKYELELAREKVKDAQNFVKACECYAAFDKDSPTAKAMYRQLNKRIKKVKQLTDEINKLKKDLQDAIVRREMTLEGRIKENIGRAKFLAALEKKYGKID